MKKLLAVMVLSSVLIVPVRAGDFNGDGQDDIAVFRPDSGLWSVRGVTRSYFGGNGDVPVPADYNGDGVDSMAVYRPYTGLWAISGGDRVYFGGINDEAKPGDYNGDGQCDLAIFRRDTGLWAVRGITRTYFGSPGDMAITTREKNYNRVSVTGQTTQNLPYDDGNYQTGLSFNYNTTYMNGDLVTVDANTGLMWAADGNEEGCNNGGTNTWSSAITYCRDLSYAGFTDWRLPNIKELQSIIDYETGIGTPCVDATAFPHIKQMLYWSSTTYNTVGAKNFAWCASFANGGVVSMLKSDSYDVYLRAVRGGE